MDELPDVDDLDELTPLERVAVHKATRLVRTGHLDEVRIRYHEQKGCLTLEWTEDGGGKLCK